MPMRALDAVDRKILVQLQANGRMSLAELADKVGRRGSRAPRLPRHLNQNTPQRKMAGTMPGHLHFIVSRAGYGAACAFAAAMSASVRNDITVTLRVR
jgi:hypothetical protein